MKKILIAACLLISAGIFAQTDSTKMNGANTGTMGRQENTPDNRMKKDGVVMTEGKMWQIRNGKTMEMKSDVKLNNGTSVSTTGMVQMPDGSTMSLKEGESMDMAGNVISRHKDHKDK